MERTSNVPEPADDFVGRGPEQKAIADAFGAGARLVTLLGPPGVGKTRLALRFASASAHERTMRALAPGGVVWVDLSEARSAADLLAAVAEDLEVPVVGAAAGAAARIGDALSGRESALLVLDNFEQLVEDGARTVAAWLKRAARLRMLVTSRETLRIAGEHPIEIGPLPVPTEDAADAAAIARTEAGQLLLARLPGYTIGPADAEHVAAIVREVDGLPLALELVAPRVRALGAAEVRQAMARLLGLDAPGSRDASPHHRTLRAAIDGSWELLEAGERDALADVSLFRGGFSVDAAQAVIDLGAHPGAPPTVAVVEALRAKSLIATAPASEGEPLRLRLLGSVRAYAEEKLGAAGRRGAAAARHARTFAALAEREIARVEEASDEALRTLLRERENLIAADETLASGPVTAESSRGRALLLLALDAVLALHGPYGPHLDRLAALLASAGAQRLEPRLRAALHAARARALRLSGEPGEALGEAAYGRKVAAGDPAAEARLFCEAGDAHAARGEFDEARSALAEAQRLAGAASDRATEQRVFAALGLLAHGQGRLADARADYSRALDLARSRGDRHAEAALLKDFGSLRLQQGSPDEARAHYEQALKLAETLDRRLAALVLGNLAILDQEAGDLDRALGRLEEALGRFGRLGDRPLGGHILCYLGMVRFERGEHDLARDALSRAVEVLGEVGDVRMEGLALSVLGAVEARCDRAETGETAFDAAERKLAAVDDPGLLATHGVLRAELDLARARGESDPVKAAELRESAHRRARDGEAQAADSDDVRYAIRVFRAGLKDHLAIGPAARWFRMPGEEPVDLSSRGTLARVLDVLVDLRLASPGAAVDADDLLARAWPDERVLPEAGRNRVKVAVTTLRKLGLKGVLLHSGDGYLIDPAIPVVRTA